MSLRKVGFAVTVARDGQDALDRSRITPPDLVLADTQLPVIDGLELCRRMKADERLRTTPFVFLMSRNSLEDRVKGHELGVDDFLVKPVLVRELVARVKLLLDKKEIARLQEPDSVTGYSGKLADVGVLDLVQKLEAGRRSGALNLRRDGGYTATIWFREGRIVDCEVGRYAGEDAFYRLLNWQQGEFDIEFRSIERADRVRIGTQGLLMEGMRRIDDWSRLVEQLPPLDQVLCVDGRRLAERLGHVPDEMNGTLKLFDGRRTIGQVIDDAEQDELAAAKTVSLLFLEGLIRSPQVRAVQLGRTAGAPTAVAGSPGAAPVRTPEPNGVDWFAGPVAPKGRSADTLSTHAAEPPRIVRFPARAKQPAGPTSPPEPSTPVSDGPPELVPLAPPAPDPSPPPGPAARHPVVQPRPRFDRIQRRLLIGGIIAAVMLGGAILAAILRSKGERTDAPVRKETADSMAAATGDARARQAELDEATAENYMTLGDAYMAEGRFVEAKKAYQRYLMAAPSGRRAAEARAALAQFKD